jgi:hypothetical protein
MTVRIIPTDTKMSDYRRGKVADAELHFDAQDGPLAGLKLIGFGIWTAPAIADGEVPGRCFSITWPARTYSVNGESRSFALLRPLTDARDQDGVRDLLLAAWRAHEVAAGLIEAQP